MILGLIFWSGLLASASTDPNLAQEARFQKFGVLSDPWAEEQIAFWKRIYSDHGSEEEILHDARDLSRIHAVVRGRGEGARVRRQMPGESRRFMRVQSGLRDRLEEAFLASRGYLRRMQEILVEEGVPHELALLPFVESAFQAEARSGAGAAGIWQFMPKTALRDLRVTPAIDERYDPLKATRAAARFLRDNRETFGSWALAVMAYHQGPALVRTAIAQVGTRDPLVLIRQFEDPRFRFASRNYLFEFLAMCDFALSREDWKRPLGPDALPPFITVSFPRKTRARELLQRYGLNETLTRELNPHFRKKIWSSEAEIPAHYPVRMAGITLEEFRRLEYPR